ncbi:MAG: hypothetical protein CM1200mP18_06980 [Gammaproteobacteria bacterium]|nr:MAG: hypothetical protein CM1200mP18_06980 [Gammaproteobacteria bacterium]
MLIEGSEPVLRLMGLVAFMSDRMVILNKNTPIIGITVVLPGTGFACQSHLVQCLLNDLPTPISGREYLQNLHIEDAIYESDRTGTLYLVNSCYFE